MKETKKEHPHQPHNNLFEETFRYKQVVIDLLNCAFPPELLELIDLDKLKQDTNSYISAELVKTFSDVVWRTKQKGGNSKVTIALLFEHKSYQPKDIFVQLLHYMSSIWVRDVAGGHSLSVIIPIIFYHGKAKWQRKIFFESFKNLSLTYKKFIPEFEYILFEVFQTPDDVIVEMSNEHLLGTLMLQYKKADDISFTRKNGEYFIKYFKEHPEKRELFRTFVTYWLSQSKMKPEELIDLINRHLSTQIVSDTMTAYQSLISRGEAKGKAEGEAKGKAEGEADKSKSAVTRMLLRGLLSIPDIADAIEVPVSFVTDIRDALIKDGKTLPNLVRDFKIS